MENILSFENVELGYCDQCGLPRSVGIFKVSNWHYKIKVCDLCLEKFRNKVVQSGHTLLREEVS